MQEEDMEVQEESMEMEEKFAFIIFSLLL